MRTLIIPLLSLFSLLPCVNTQARVIHVPADSSCIQCAINGAVDGDTVLVARGHYYERINFLGKAILVASNFIIDHDTTSIDSTIIDADTSILGTSDTGSVVVFLSGEDSNSVIEGFTLQNGIGTLARLGNRSGGGIYCDEFAWPTINSNTISDNSAYKGGGICCSWYSSPTITNNTITGNYAGGAGGGICCEKFFPISNICNNVITGNSADLYGGGIYCAESSPTITNNTISRNSAVQWGGGIACILQSSPTISHNTITNNSVTSYGGGIFSYLSSSPTISNNTISYNSAGTRGGAIYCMEHSSPIIINNIISDSPDGEGIYCAWSYPVISHNAVWNNNDGNFFGCPAGVGDTTWGTNFNGMPCDSFYNIICCPLFCYPDTGNYYLAENSCCVGAGCDSLGNPDSTVDMGAFGVGCPPLFPPDPFSLLFPPNKAFTPRGVRFDWETATDPDPSDQVMYDLYVSTSYRFPSDSTTIDSNLVMSEYVKTLDYGAYYWKVKARDNHEAERWSNQLRYFMVTGSHASLLGNLNSDGSINVEDVAFLINYLYTSGPVPEPLWVGDANCDGLVDIADIVCLINYLFIGGTLPCGF
jgi:parallel beta-helix repeat protein